MDLYHAQILDLYKHPLNAGRLAQAQIQQHELNPTCGDEITVSILVQDEAVADVRFEGSGCAISQASASLLTEEIKGQKLSQVLQITPEHVVELLGITLSPTRLKCALLSLQAITRGIHAFYQQSPSSPDSPPVRKTE